MWLVKQIDARPIIQMLCRERFELAPHDVRLFDRFAQGAHHERSTRHNIMAQRFSEHGAKHAHAPTRPPLDIHGVDCGDLARWQPDEIGEFGVAIEPAVTVNRRD